MSGMSLLAQVGVAGGFIQWAIIIVVVAAVVALVCVGLRQFGITIPPFIIQVIWIVIAAVIIIAAILFVAKMAGWA